MRRLEDFQNIDEESIVQWLDNVDREEVAIPTTTELIEMVQGVQGIIKNKKNFLPILTFLNAFSVLIIFNY